MNPHQDDPCHPPHRPGRSSSLALAALAAVWLSACACAQPGGGQGRPPAPPPEALAACQAASAGQACSFSTPQGQLSGSCWAPAGKPLACKPPHPAPGGASAPAGVKP